MGSVLKLTGGPFYDTVRQNLDLYDRLAAAILEWHKAFSPENRAQLVMRESPLGLMIFDSRPVAPAERVILLGLRARLYRLAKEPVSLKRIQAALPDDSAGDIQTCLDELVSR